MILGMLLKMNICVVRYIVLRWNLSEHQTFKQLNFDKSKIYWFAEYSPNAMNAMVCVQNTSLHFNILKVARWLKIDLIALIYFALQVSVSERKCVWFIPKYNWIIVDLLEPPKSQRDTTFSPNFILTEKF